MLNVCIYKSKFLCRILQYRPLVLQQTHNFEYWSITSTGYNELKLILFEFYHTCPSSFLASADVSKKCLLSQFHETVSSPSSPSSRKMRHSSSCVVLQLIKTLSDNLYSSWNLPPDELLYVCMRRFKSASLLLAGLELKQSRLEQEGMGFPCQDSQKLSVVVLTFLS